MTRALGLLCVVVAALALVAPAGAAAPNYILVSGPGLRHPILLADWSENARLLLAVANARVAGKSLTRGLTHRRRFDLAEFWGWGGNPRPTRPSDANQHGWFYPAREAQPALIDLTVNGNQVPRLVPVRVAAILRRHDVPTRY